MFVNSCAMIARCGLCQMVCAVVAGRSGSKGFGGYIQDTESKRNPCVDHKYETVPGGEL